MALTKEEIERITKEAIEKAELEAMGLSVMIPFAKYADKALFGNAHYIKKADKKLGITTDSTELNTALFLRLFNKAMEKLNLPHRVESAWTGKLSYTVYDPTRADNDKD
tara:strand:- start:239 stop:565 length:327 start_codon:yes stop_codon:yes gene_type:complete